MSGRRTQIFEKGLTVLVRTLLIALLLVQCTALWVVTHTSPTRLPVSVVDVFAELTSGQIDFDCREVTVDNRGRVRLAGVRLSASEYPEDALLGDVDILPDWRSLLLGQPKLIGLQVRAHATLGGHAGSSVDDLVVRVTQENGAMRMQAAARTGSMVLRADALKGGASPSSANAKEASELPWHRDLILHCLRGLRSVEGAIGFTVTPDGTTCTGGFIENPAALNPLPVRIGRGILRGHWGSQAHFELCLDEVHVGRASVERARFSLGKSLLLKGTAEGICFDGLVNATVSGEGRWKDDGRVELSLVAHTAASHLSTELELHETSLRIYDAAARLNARDLTRLSFIAQAARGAGVDLGGHIEILGGEAVWINGELTTARANFTTDQTGWGDLRPVLVRPEHPFPRFSGELALDMRANRLALTRLNLAGIAGEIVGGLRAGDAFAIHLHSTPENPVNPSCLNALLGSWWIDLWSRFDLSTRRTLPHADVRVTGKWGVLESIHTTVRAQLSTFGFMGARFLSTDLWVFAHPNETLVRIDSLCGELDGQAAGSARGTVRWDWRRPEWQGLPQIDAEGDLFPACALRLYNAETAARIRGWSFERPELRVAIGPGRPLRVDLKSTGTSAIEGVRVDDLQLTATEAQGTKGDLVIEATGNLSGGKASLGLSGNLTTRNHLQVSIREWSRTGAANLIEQLGGPKATPVAGDSSALTLIYEGDWDFTQPRNPTGKGQISLTDPNLKTIHLFGLLSSGLDTLGIGISSYPLDRAEIAFVCADGRAVLDPVRFIGEDASLNLKGTISFQDGALNLTGRFQLKESPWGPLKYINPNRLITNMITVDVGGTAANPKVQTKVTDLGKLK